MDAIGLNLKYMVTNSIYAMDGYHAILEVSIKIACSEKLTIFKNRKENYGNC